MAQKQQKAKYRIGVYCIISSFLLWIIPPIAPFLGMAASFKWALVTGSVILAEILFWVGVLIVGKEAANKYRSYLNPRNWRRIKESTSSKEN